jgi:predicted DNA-binding transcriptional regulator YafY/transposase-like protein
MINYRVKDFDREFPDNESCLEWLKNRLYPNGIECPRCKKVTKHHKVSKRPCYACDNCGNHIHPTAGTIFRKSTIPLKTWFAVIYKLSRAKNGISAKKIQQDYGMTYRTAKRLLQKSREFLDKNPYNFFEARSNNPHRRSIRLSLRDRGIPDKKPITNVVRGKFEGNHSVNYRKRDRTARLLRLQMLLAQSPLGLRIEEIASKCSISKRTVYRDLVALESEIGVPIWEQGNKRGIVEDYFLPPVNFTIEEAMNVFLAVRLMQNYCYVYNPSVISTFNKLERIIPEPLKKWIQDTIEHLESQPRDERRINNFNKLARAWLSKHKARIYYLDPVENDTGEYIIDIYYIEPSILGHSSYMIAYCHTTKSIHDYKLDYIIGNVSIEEATYEIPPDFKIKNYFSSAWDSHIMEPQVVKLRFTKNIRKAIIDTKWHPLQRIELQSDGSGIMTLEVRDTLYFRAWVLGWGDNMEVLEPETLRNEITQFATSMVNLYTRK